VKAYLAINRVVISPHGRGVFGKEAQVQITFTAQHQALVWVEKAKSFYSHSGKRIALAEFTNPKGLFVEDELYIFVLSNKGTMLAHGVNEKYVGEEWIDLKDEDGKPFVKEIVDKANAKGSGWVTYKWHHPITRKLLPKTVYFEKVDDLIICSGVYAGETSLEKGVLRPKIIVHLGSCGIAAGARTVMDALMSEIANAGATNIQVSTSGCAGMCSREPMITVEMPGQEPIIYGHLDANKMRQVFRGHVLQGEVQNMFMVATN
jgi:(2Fe-2S) ferredoxin